LVILERDERRTRRVCEHRMARATIDEFKSKRLGQHAQFGKPEVIGRSARFPQNDA
jgi:hypothetical protein